MAEHGRKRYSMVKPEDTDTLVIHCSDSRFQSAFHSFIHEELAIENPVPIIVPGGIHDLISPTRIKAARHIWDQFEFLVKKGHLKRVILLNHEDCHWYGRWSSLVQTAIGSDITTHLLLVVEKIAKKKLGVDVECYLAKIIDGEIEFFRVDKV